jgi:hypothetical protein
MTIHWPFLLPALLLLLTPVGIFHGSRVRYRSLPQDWRDYWGATFGLGLHTIDLLRATLGAWYLLTALAPAAGASSLAKQLSPAIGGLLLCTATVVQAVVCRERHALHAPFAFVAGITFGFLAPVVGIFAVLIAVIFARGTRSAPAFFPILALAMVGTNFLFGNFNVPPAVWYVAVAAAAPWFYALLFQRHWVVTHAAKRSSRSVPSAPDPLR